MADRWSNPSGSRFRVWPDGTDSYDYSDLATNWNTLDAIIGAPPFPPCRKWPPTEGLGGGLWREIQKAKEAMIPVGAVLPWFRANTTMQVPNGWVLADGSTIPPEEHEIPNVSGPYTVPDLRNRFVLGASSLHEIDSSGVDITSGLINSSAGAPGPQGIGGENTTVLTTAQMASHLHAGSVTGWGPREWTWYSDSGSEIKYPPTNNYDVVRSGAGCSTSVGQGGIVSGQHQHKISLAVEGESLPHENRPLYVGLVWIVKVKNP